MNTSPIPDDAEYKAALKEVAPYFDAEPEPGTADAIRFELLITSIQAYEDQHFPIRTLAPLG
ncbi:MAG: DNA-binding protein [Ramlibacter sp.]|jgi:HTH-type transcriptional regulator/antitoxin HigA|nr:DNA-binding protein [Ramlibacter sp.]